MVKTQLALNIMHHFGSVIYHKLLVFLYLLWFCIRLMWRAMFHDMSKFGLTYGLVEVSGFIKVIHKLRDTTYGSPEYKELCDQIAPCIAHHHKVNRHHPEHFENGVDAMNLLDVVEMFYDWKAAAKRHKDGDIKKSIEKGKDRFHLSEQLCNILNNHV